MLLKKRIRGGVLLYALLMSAVFTLILQFYLSRLVAAHQQITVMEAANTAYMIAHLTKTNASEASGQMAFTDGVSHYEEKDKVLVVSVTLKTSQQFSYRFPTKAAPDGASEKENDKQTIKKTKENQKNPVEKEKDETIDNPTSPKAVGEVTLQHLAEQVSESVSSPEKTD